jgi:hypothetical protein
MSDAMTEEEYLSARGWKQSIGAWSREYGDRADWMPTAEAVAVQLEDDRRLYNFVRARSEMKRAMLFPNKPEDAVATDAWLLSQAKGTGRT